MRLSKIRWIVAFLAAIAVASCQASGRGPATWIDRPLDGDEFSVQEPVSIKAHASDASGVTRFQFFLDDKLIAIDAGSGQRLGEGNAGWVPTAAGTYYVHARATNGAGIVGADAISRIVVRDPQQFLVCCPVPKEKIPETPTSTPVPPAPPPSTNITITPSPSPSPPPPAACANSAAFVQDVTIPPGTALAPNQAFNKIWRVRNNGTCPWDANVRLTLVGGETLATQVELAVPATAPGATADLLVPMTAPAVLGQHYSQWRIHDNKQWLGPGLEVWLNVVSAQPPPPPPPQPQPQCPGAPAIASFTADLTTINAGQAAILSWGAVTNATSASIDPDIGGVPTPGSVSVRPNQTTTYTLTATGCGGTTRRQVRIVVNPVSQPPQQPPPPQPPPPPADITPPSISNASASPLNVSQSGCGQSTTTTVTATVTDTQSGVDHVVARLTGVGGGEVPMPAVGGNIYRAPVGPFSSLGQLTIRVVAYDKAGNVAQSTSFNVGVVCIK